MVAYLYSIGGGLGVLVVVAALALRIKARSSWSIILTSKMVNGELVYYRNKLFRWDGNVQSKEEFRGIENEKTFYYIYRLILGADPQNIQVKGAALVARPHGFACVYGSEDSLLKFASRKNTLLVCKFGDDIDTLFPNCTKGLLRLNFIKANAKKLAGQYILLVRESPTCTTIPGGKRFLGETSLECALREFNEETGLVLDMEPEEVIYSEEERANYYIFHKL